MSDRWESDNGDTCLVEAPSPSKRDREQLPDLVSMLKDILASACEIAAVGVEAARPRSRKKTATVLHTISSAASDLDTAERRRLVLLGLQKRESEIERLIEKYRARKESSNRDRGSED